MKALKQKTIFGTTIRVMKIPIGGKEFRICMCGMSLDKIYIILQLSQLYDIFTTYSCIRS
jgi:hypothetical protein